MRWYLKIIAIFLFILIVPTINALESENLQDAGISTQHEYRDDYIVGIANNQPTFTKDNLSIGWFYAVPGTFDVTQQGQGGSVESPVEQSPIEELLSIATETLQKVPRNFYILLALLIISLLIFFGFSDGEDEKEKRRIAKQKAKKAKEEAERRFKEPVILKHDINKVTKNIEKKL